MPRPTRLSPRSSTHDEVQLDFPDIFFSRTDGRGVIEAFNNVFLRVSEFSAEELFHAPHKIVRHPDMPKGLYHFYWERLKAGKPTGAYIKNRTKSGRSYWVYATTLPLPDGGFLSVRIKPSTELFSAMSDAYGRLRLAETEEGLTPAASSERFQLILRTLGFDSYDQFQAQALAGELKSRAEHNKNAPDGRTMLVRTLVEAAAVVRQERKLVMGVLDALRLLPTNMRLISHRIERGHGPLSVLSERYGAMAEMLLSQLTDVIRSEAEEGATEAEALFACASADLLGEAAKSFRRSAKPIPNVDREAEGARLDALARTTASLAVRTTASSGRDATRLARDLEMLRRSTLALDSIRVMGRVEFGQMALRSRDLANVIQRIDESHRTINAHLERLSQAVQQIEDAGALLSRDAA